MKRRGPQQITVGLRGELYDEPSRGHYEMAIWNPMSILHMALHSITSTVAFFDIAHPKTVNDVGAGSPDYYSIVADFQSLSEAFANGRPLLRGPATWRLPGAVAGCQSVCSRSACL